MPVLDAQLEGFGGFHSGLAFIHISQQNIAVTMVFFKVGLVEDSLRVISRN
ncbi:hypothetical protein IRZ74_14420 [Pseudomonas monteilii]|nr:hypothetical protein [Pseudomonas monteilii]